MEINKRIAARARRAYEAAERIAAKAEGWEVRSRIEEIRLHFDGYAEPGYSTATGIIATGNWNTIDRYDRETQKRVDVSDLPKRLGNIFEKLGIDCEWSDEWSECSNCYKLIRTSPDSYSYQPSYVVGEGEIHCHECVKEDPEEYLLSLEGDADRCATIKGIDPEDHGYVKVNTDPYESGWHPGQTDSPQRVANELRAKGIDRFLFRLDEASQFFSRWSAYVHGDEADRLK